MENKDKVKKKDRRPTYEPPKAVDLSDSKVSGKQPCRPGNGDAFGCGPGNGHGGSQ